jgi:hypothetical protein
MTGLHNDNAPQWNAYEITRYDEYGGEGGRDLFHYATDAKAKEEVMAKPTGVN